MKKRLLWLCVFIFSFLLSFPLYTEASNDYYELESCAKEYALSFMTNTLNNQGIDIREFFPLYNLDDAITGYYVSFTSAEGDCGYILLSLISGQDPIVELSLEGSGIVDYLLQKTELKMDLSEKIRYLGPDNLYIPVTGEDDFYMSVYSQNYISSDELILAADNISNVCSVEIHNGIINWEETSLSPGSIYKIPNFGTGSTYWLMTDFASNAASVCAPTAATNVLWFWGYRYNRTSVMQRSGVSTQPTLTAKANKIYQLMHLFLGTVDQVGTMDSEVIDGYTGYFMESPSASGTWNYRKINNHSSYSAWQTLLNGGCPVHAILYSGAVLISTVSHHVFCFGYAESTSGTQYLQVMDGWYDHGRLVKFDYYPNFWGYKIFVR